MTKKDYELIADALVSSFDKDVDSVKTIWAVLRTIGEIATSLKRQDPTFDREAFINTIISKEDRDFLFPNGIYHL